MELDKQRIAELVGKIQGGDNSAFEELYNLTSKRAFFVALEFVKNDQDAEDILQESYIKALSRINELDKPESFSSWFNQIVANKSKDFLKKKKPTLFEADEHEVFEAIPDEDTGFSPEENLDQTELQKTVMEVLDELSEEKRACVLMMYFEELSVGEIAETLEIPEGTVKTRLFSARKDLKEKFAKRGITSLYSTAPIGVVIWALRRMSDAVSKTFVGSGASAKVLAGITAAGAGSAAGIAVAGTTAATTAAAAGTGAATATATGTGIAAKIAALTVAQKIVAGVSVAAVVAGSAAGVATVVNDNGKKDDISTTAYTEEYTTAPSFETTLAVEVLGTVEFSETTTLSLSDATSVNSSTAKQSTTKLQSTTDNTTAKSASTSVKHTTTKKQTTTSTKATTTQKPTTTKKETTTKVTTTEKETTTKKVTTTKETTTKKQTTTTKPTTTVKETTTAKVPEIGYTTPVSEGTQIAVVKISIINLDNTVEKIINYTVPEGTVMTEDYLYSLCESAGYYPDFGFDGEAVGKTAQAGETYTVDAKL